MARETAAAHRSVQAFVDLQNQWVSEIKADPDIGGDRLKASLASAARAIDRLNVPGLREALNFTGAGNHPAVVKAFVRLGQMISEDRFRPGRARAGRRSRDRRPKSSTTAIPRHLRSSHETNGNPCFFRPDARRMGDPNSIPAASPRR